MGHWTFTKLFNPIKLSDRIQVTWGQKEIPRWLFTKLSVSWYLKPFPTLTGSSWTRHYFISRLAGTLFPFQVKFKIICVDSINIAKFHLVPTPETTDLSSGFWPCFVLSLSILGLVLAACVFAFIIWKWNTPTVRKAGHIFLILILAGICCIFTANLLWSVQVSILICTIKGILSYLGVTLCCG